MQAAVIANTITQDAAIKMIAAAQKQAEEIQRNMVIACHPDRSEGTADLRSFR